MTKKRILLLSVSAGAGHMRAAEAIRAHAAMHGEDLVVTHLDAMDYVSGGFRKLYADYYITLVNKLPAVWGYLYQVTNDAMPDSPMQKLRRAIERLSTRELRKEIKAFEPDAIICTHFLPAEMLSRMIRKGKIDCPVWVQVTDFDLHRMWVQDHIAGYFAANEEVAFRMRAQGIPAENIHVTGIPIMPAFGQALDRKACAAEYGLDPARPTVLLMGGGAGLGSLDAVAERLLSVAGDYQLIALAGKNKAALEALQGLTARYPGRLFPQGFTNKVEHLMACADLVITKPGGLTASECLAVGLPMIVNSPIPGQEERNADFLLEQGAALKACDPVTLEYRVLYLLGNPARLAEMRAKARALGRPDAAAQVLARVLA
ncbi:MGDG synthase family glycosyltransferase [Uliginosibacterium gangwonense]|uniref:MGDG synthase family glycosyltransferase n=1 Tax=Uliginosibacterium gangwonense TaxID=392736 RepID=UPI00037F7B75|nr:glycosyltransferase [Uliginosibacterium gangwonense]